MLMLVAVIGCAQRRTETVTTTSETVRRAPPRTTEDAVVRSEEAELRRLGEKVAGAVDELKLALAESDPDVRVAAVRELGSMRCPELLPLLKRPKELHVAGKRASPSPNTAR